jgi:RNA 3'-phosphate cyclase
MQLLEIDGSQGEGGGQILRTALTFSVIQSRPVRVSRVRAGRQVPGLRRQHVAALNVLAQIFDGELSGAVEGSSQVSFVPGKMKLRSLSIDMKTAASITLVLQAVIPAAALSGSSVSLELQGGTDVPWSPTFDYFSTVVRNVFAAIGIEFEAKALRRGFYPRGGGRATAIVQPSKGIRQVDLITPPIVHDVRIWSRCGRLPSHVAERQMTAAVSALKAAGYNVNGTDVASDDADSPGSSVLVSALGGGEFLGSDSLGKKGIPAEEVGRTAAESLVGAISAGATVDSNLADMVLPLLCLGGAPSRVKVPKVTPHLETSLAIAKQFTSCSYRQTQADRCWMVEVAPAHPA